jgi:hypothetical protein
LTDDLGADVVFVDGDNELISDVTVNELIPRGVLTVGVAGSFQLEDLDDGGLLWWFRIPQIKGGRGYAPLVTELEEDVRNDPAYGLGPQDSVKFAVALIDDVAADRFGELIDAEFTINGDSVSSQFPTYYRRLTGVGGDWSPVIDEITNDFQPQIILTFDQTVTENVIVPIEAAWPTGVPKPRWITLFPEPALADAVGADPSLAARLRGGLQIFNPNSRLYNQLIIRVEQLTELVPIEPVTQFYDAAYALAYAYTITRNIPDPTGADIAATFGSMNPPGQLVDTKPSDLENALNVLLGSGDLDINGATGFLDLDVQNGSVDGFYNTWCFADPDNDNIFTEEKAAQVYDTKTKAIIGTYSCPGPLPELTQ